jgi:hypothetical protein
MSKLASFCESTFTRGRALVMCSAGTCERARVLVGTYWCEKKKRIRTAACSLSHVAPRPCWPSSPTRAPSLPLGSHHQHPLTIQIEGGHLAPQPAPCFRALSFQCPPAARLLLSACTLRRLWAPAGPGIVPVGPLHRCRPRSLLLHFAGGPGLALGLEGLPAVVFDRYMVARNKGYVFGR